MNANKTSYWSQEEIQYLIENYGFKETSEISKYLNRTGQAIRMKAMYLNVNKKIYREWNQEDIDKLIKHYQSKTKKELLEIFPDRTWSKIKSKATNLKIARQRKNPDIINGDCSKLLEETNEAYYWIGFLLADGHFSKENRLKCSLSVVDANHLEKLSNLLQTHSKIYKRKLCKDACNRNDTINISVMDKFFIGKIKEKFDIDNNKTENPPNLSFYRSLPVHLFISLLIGFIDGDGHIAFQTGRKDCKIVIQIHSSWVEFLNLAKNRLEEILKIKIPEARINKSGYCFIVFSNLKICRYLKLFTMQYNLPVLNRKWDLIDEKKISKYEIAEKNKPLIEKELENGLSVKQIIDKLNVTEGQILRLKYKYK
ncbi:MAG: hypothetical protein EKK57_05045 [Proteobacteria bacterium]|nr:MAG: hypothetical protein EKK57_05045 [Pseudomonadota bacterium]